MEGAGARDGPTPPCAPLFAPRRPLPRVSWPTQSRRQEARPCASPCLTGRSYRYVGRCGPHHVALTRTLSLLPRLPQRRFDPAAPLSAVRDFAPCCDGRAGRPPAAARGDRGARGPPLRARGPCPRPRLPASLPRSLFGFQVSTNLPRRTFRIGAPGSPDAALTLSGAGLHPQAVLFVTLGSQAVQAQAAAKQ